LGQIPAASRWCSATGAGCLWWTFSHRSQTLFSTVDWKQNYVSSVSYFKGWFQF
jgi:hypothetical protein